MKRRCVAADHLNRRAFLKGALCTAAGTVLPNWGGLFHSSSMAAEAAKRGKRCILLWMAGGPSQIDTFDMKPGRPTSGPFRPVATRVPGIQISEYLPHIARHADKLCILRSMTTTENEHPGGTYLLHTGYRREQTISYPDMGAVVGKYLGHPDPDLPNYVQIGYRPGESTSDAGAGFLGPAFQPFRLQGASAPDNMQGYLPSGAELRRNGLLRFLEEAQATPSAEELELRTAQERSWRLLKARDVFDVSKEWPKYRELYGGGGYGQQCLLARRLVESGVPFVECALHNFDSHYDNFEHHKGLLPAFDAAWAGLLQDLDERGLLADTLVVWMGEFGRTPKINHFAGRDHFCRAWSAVLAGGGIRGGIAYGETDRDGQEVKDRPLSVGDFFATVYQAVGVNPRTRHHVDTRPVRIAPEGAQVITDILA